MSATPPAVETATSTMISLIGSLADNKSALGRRYGDCRISPLSGVSAARTV